MAADTSAMFDGDLITDSKISNFNHDPRFRHQQACGTIVYMICFALLATTVFYYNLIVYLTENKPMILPYSYHKTRDSLRRLENSNG